MAEQNHYKTLGVRRKASQEEIREAYRKRVLCCHPDVAGEGSTKEFRAVQDAYEILSKPEKRARYDRRVLRTTPSRRAGDRSGSKRVQMGISDGDLAFEVVLDPREARLGTRLEIPVVLLQTCSACGGSGLMGGWPCHLCEGRRSIRRRAYIFQELPGGVSHGDQLLMESHINGLGRVLFEFFISIQR